MQAIPDLAVNLDFSKAEYIKPAFLLEDWRGRESDLLCLIPYLFFGGMGLLLGAAASILLASLLSAHFASNKFIPAIIWNLGIAGLAFGTLFFLLQMG